MVGTTPTQRRPCSPRAALRVASNAPSYCARVARSIEENPPRFGQFDPARLTQKQLDIELGLDRLDPLAERWLLHTEPLGCPRNVSLFGDSDEVTKMSQFHCHIHFDMSFR